MARGTGLQMQWDDKKYQGIFGGEWRRADRREKIRAWREWEGSTPGSWRVHRQLIGEKFWSFCEWKYLLLNPKSFEMLACNSFLESFDKIFCPQSLTVVIWEVMGWVLIEGWYSAQERKLLPLKNRGMICKMNQFSGSRTQGYSWTWVCPRISGAVLCFPRFKVCGERNLAWIFEVKAMPPCLSLTEV